MWIIHFIKLSVFCKNQQKKCNIRSIFTFKKMILWKQENFQFNFYFFPAWWPFTGKIIRFCPSVARGVTVEKWISCNVARSGAWRFENQICVHLKMASSDSTSENQPNSNQISETSVKPVPENRPLSSQNLCPFDVIVTVLSLVVYTADIITGALTKLMYTFPY